MLNNEKVQAYHIACAQLGEKCAMYRTLESEISDLCDQVEGMRQELLAAQQASVKLPEVANVDASAAISNPA